MRFFNYILLLFVVYASGTWSSSDGDSLVYTFGRAYYNVVSLTWSDTSSYYHFHKSTSYMYLYWEALPSKKTLKAVIVYKFTGNRYFRDIISTITLNPPETKLTGLRLYTSQPQGNAFHGLKNGRISVGEQPTPNPTAIPTPFPTWNPTATPTEIPTEVPTEVPTVSPTRFCDAALCYGNGAFGANCSGPPDEINYPITVTKSTNSNWDGSIKPEDHVEVFPAFSIDLQRNNEVRFDAKITNISDGANHGAVFAVSVKYSGCQSTHSQLFSLTQPMLAATSCDDNEWHSWELKIHFDAIEVSCDENVVWNHARTDMQVSWEVGEVSPFLAIGAYYSPVHKTWRSLCDMVIQNVEIITCETETPSSTPSKSPTSPTRAPTSSPTLNPTKTPTTIPTNYPSANPTESPTSLPTDIPTFYPTSSCDIFTAGCYGQDAFGAQCKGPTTDVGFPITLTKAKTTNQREQKGVYGSHIEVYPAKSIDLTTGIKIRFNAKIFDITGGINHGTVMDISVKYNGSDSGVFTFNQPKLASTSCNDAKWHVWETVVYKNTVRLFCDETLVHTHSRTDSQKTWKVNDGTPFLVLGAHFANSHYYSRCHMIVHDLRIFTC